MKTIKFQLEPLTCPSCIKKIETKLGKMDGVEEAK
ncbi:heavy-metal-associated domain-containing protein, partial [Oceanobacillus caeni]